MYEFIKSLKSENTASLRSQIVKLYVVFFGIYCWWHIDRVSVPCLRDGHNEPSNHFPIMNLLYVLIETILSTDYTTGVLPLVKIKKDNN